MGASLARLAVGDFNGDTALDLVGTDRSADKAIILYGDSVGRFFPARELPTLISPTAVAVADFDGDGYQDLAVSDWNSQSVGVYMGTSSGEFAARMGFPVGVRPQAIAVGDVSRDGKLDLAVANYNSDNVSVLLGRYEMPTAAMRLQGGASATNSRVVRVDSQVSEATEMRLRDQGGQWGAWSAITHREYWTLPAGDGSKTVEAQYRNSVGETGVVADTILLDTTAPSTTDDTGSGWLRVSPASVTLTSVDSGSGVARTEYSFGGGWTTGTVVPVFGSGRHTVLYRAVDNAGNVADVKVCSVGIDVTAPVSEAVGARSGAWYDHDVTLTFQATDDLSGVVSRQYSMNFGMLYLDWTEATSVVVSAQGTTYVGYRAIDAAGNVEDGRLLTINIDKTAPVTTDDAPSGWVGGSPCVVTLEPSDAGGSGLARTQYRVDAATSWSEGTEVEIAGDGAHVLRYRSVDTAGNVEDTQFTTVSVDATAPALSVTGAGGAWRKGPAFVQGLATDAGSGVASVRHRLDDGGWADGVGLLVAEEGEHTVAFAAEDAAGNETERTAQVKIDLTAPSTTAEAPKAWSNAAVTVAFSAADELSGMSGGAARTEYSVDGGATWSRGTSAVVEPDSVGHATDAQPVLYRSVDNAGNTEAAKSCVARIDTCPPVGFAQTARAKRGGPARFRVTVTDAVPGSPTATVVVRIRARAGGKLLKTLPAVGVPTNAAATVTWAKCRLAPGTYRYEALATDAAGNRQSRVGAAKLVVR